MSCQTILRWFWIIAPRVLTLLLSIGYLVLGGYVFCTIEGWASPTGPSNSTVSDLHFKQAKSKLETSIFGSVNEESVRRIYQYELYWFINTYYDRKEQQEGWTLLDGVLYCYSSVTTIGYSHLSTRTDLGRVLFVFYNIIGIPLCTLVLADWGLLIGHGLHRLCRFVLSALAARVTFLHGWSSSKPLSAPIESLLLLPIVLLLYLIYVTLGGLLLPIWEQGWSFVEGFYVAFDGTTTIGIGDIYPGNEQYFLATLLYTSVGIAIASTAMGAMGDYLRVLHHAGETPVDCGLQVVWFGGKHMRVNKLVQIIGKEFGATEYEIRAVQDRLDIIVNRAFDKRSLEKLEEEATKRRKKLRTSSSRDRWHDSTVTPLTLVPVRNASTLPSAGSFYGTDRQADYD